VVPTVGDTDFLAVAHVHDSDAVGALLRRFEAVDGVVRTNSTDVVETLHDDPRRSEATRWRRCWRRWSRSDRPGYMNILSYSTGAA
jgi:hypothetical protein